MARQQAHKEQAFLFKTGKKCHSKREVEQSYERKWKSGHQILCIAHSVHTLI